MREELLAKLRAKAKERWEKMSPEERTEAEAKRAADDAWYKSERGQVVRELRRVMGSVYQNQQGIIVHALGHAIEPVNPASDMMVSFSLRDAQAHWPGHEGELVDLPSLERIRSLLSWLKGDRSAPMPPEAEGVITVQSYHRCPYCGMFLTLRFQGMGELRADAPCSAPVGPLVVRIPVPSGILAVGNDFREYAPFDHTALSREDSVSDRAYIESGAKHGIVMAVLHESHGRIRRQPDGSIFVGGNVGGEEFPEALDLEGFWRSFADGDRIPETEEYVARLPVPPGVYEFTFHYLDRDWQVPEYCRGATVPPHITIRRVEE